jgi:hypothetical protein
MIAELPNLFLMVLQRIELSEFIREDSRHSRNPRPRLDRVDPQSLS